MKNKKTLKIGRSDFKRMVKNNHYFVDKTLLIYDFYNNANDILLMPRPRRFGKTLNLSMIEHFFDINKKDSAKLFSEFEISEKKEFCKQHQNKYPVINISLKNVKASSWNDCFENFKTAISDLYKKHDYLLNSEKIKTYDKQIIEQIILETAKDKYYKFGLKLLSEYLKTHFEKDVIILVDEYDTPIIYSFEYTPKPVKKGTEITYYGNAIDFMQTLLGTAFKENDNLQKGLITGIMRIGKESTFSDWNNFNVFSITSTYFADKFGFTEKETQEILEYFDLRDKFDNVKQWYDGYKFGNIDKIYNPWSIVNYIAFKNDGLKPYWVNTSSDTLIKERIIEPGMESDLQKLIVGETIEKEIDENFIFADFDTDKELLWTLLTYNGYLTTKKKISGKEYELIIPNYEVKTVFIDTIIKWLRTDVKIRKSLLQDTANYLINNEIDKFETGFKEIMGDTFSYYDTAKNHEYVYHSYILGLLAIIGDDYIIKSNKESGEGRYDIMLIPHDKSKYGVVIEIKQIEKRHNEKDEIFNKRINRNIEQALNQINENKYYAELIVSKVEPENIIKLAIVFAGKEPYITPLPIDEKEL